MPYKDAELERAKKRESARRRRAGESRPSRRPLPALDELRVRTAQDVLAALNEALEDARHDADLTTQERVRLVVYVCGGLLKAMELGELEDRLRTLEAAVAGRRAA